MNNDALIDAFLEMMSAERGAAENTLSSYRRDLEDAAAFCNAKGQKLAGAATDTIRAYGNIERYRPPAPLSRTVPGSALGRVADQRPQRAAVKPNKPELLCD